jgi:amino acid transporter
LIYISVLRYNKIKFYKKWGMMAPKQGKISFFAAVMMSINIMVGAGILYAVGSMTATADTISFMGWPLIGILLLPVVLGLSKAAQLFPGDGGFYNYCAKGLSPTAGFIAQWGFFLGYMGTASSLATVLREGIIKNGDFQLLHDYPIIFNLVLVIAYVLINLMPVEKLTRLQSVGTLLKVTPILMAIGLLCFYYDSELSLQFSQLGNLGLTVSTVLFSFWGFETCCSIGGLLKDGPQKVGKVIMVGFFSTMALYFFFHLSVLYIMGAENLATHGAINFPRYLGLSPSLQAALQVGISGAILFSWANSILGVSLANITSLNSLADQKLFLGHEALSEVNRYQRPHFAALLFGVILFGLITFIQDIEILFALTSLGILTAISLTLAAVLRYQWQARSILQILLSLLSCICCAVLIYCSAVKLPSAIYAAPLVGGLLFGLVMYKLQAARAAVSAG